MSCFPPDYQTAGSSLKDIEAFHTLWRNVAPSEVQLHVASSALLAERLSDQSEDVAVELLLSKAQLDREVLLVNCFQDLVYKGHA